jgi:hypothetical protein
VVKIPWKNPMTGDVREKAANDMNVVFEDVNRAVMTMALGLAM